MYASSIVLASLEQHSTADCGTAGAASSARGVCRLVHLGAAQCEHQLGHDGDGDLLRALGADVDADRRMDAFDLGVGETGLLQALGALGVVAPGAERAD